jgi:hypothetical protein
LGHGHPRCGEEEIMAAVDEMAEIRKIRSPQCIRQRNIWLKKKIGEYDDDKC